MPARAQDLKRTDCDYVLRVITTTFDTDKKLPWLRDDYLYNLQISNQNVGYSMPPHLSYNAYAWYKSLPAMGKDEIGKKSTGIDRVSTDASASETWYDLSGRRVAKPRTPGVYVRNGKKVVIK